MTCTRETYISDWQSWRDAIDAWQGCNCMVCNSALSEVPERLRTDSEQTTLNAT